VVFADAICERTVEEIPACGKSSFRIRRSPEETGGRIAARAGHE
jgi:hypothetical protein